MRLGHLGYATTVHRAQGATVDTAHALVDPEIASRELFYVAMTRGKERNHAYVIQPDPHEVEAHLDPPEPRTGTEQIARVLARSDVDLSATETRALEADTYVSLSTLLDEYDVLVRDAQSARWEAYLDIAPFPDGVADEVFTSPFYDRLEGALARHEAAGHSPTSALATLAPYLTRETGQADPAVRLAAMLDEATGRLPRRPNARPRVAGVFAAPTGPLPDDVQLALTQRQTLIETAARQLVSDALKARAAWIGRAPAQVTNRTEWQACLATIALYRHRYDIQSQSPLGSSESIACAEQAAELRAAEEALTRMRWLARAGTEPTSPRRGVTSGTPTRRGL